MSALPYGLTIFLSAWVLFLIQPLIAKILLPIFGGVPSVWNICMMFFQGILLLGYCYAHILSKLSYTAQKWLQYFLLGASFFILPILLNSDYASTITQPTLSLLKLLSYKIALPLFLLSSTSPLVQKWYSKTNLPNASDPYFLYSISNLGSLGALLSFPFILEPTMGMHTLLILWSITYCLYVTSLVYTMHKSKPLYKNITKSTPNDHPNVLTRLQWLLLSFAPSSLLLGVTTYITTDIAATPLLWILPFSLFLLSYIIAFARRPFITKKWLINNLAFFIFLPLLALSKIVLLTGFELIFFHLIGFFALCMVCLVILADSRPNNTHLTEFYFWLGLGGFLGGLFNSIIAPQIFTGIYEYHLAFALCLFLTTRLLDWQNLSKYDLISPAMIAVLLVLNYILIQYYPVGSITLISNLCIFGIIIYILSANKNQIQFALNISLLLLFFLTLPFYPAAKLIHQTRNFFGVTRVYLDHHRNHILMSGTTVHGVQYMSQPMSVNRAALYYGDSATLNDYLQQQKSNMKVAIAGLGIGTLSCQFKPEAQVTYYEIDPTMIEIASNASLFSNLKMCPPNKIILGDARLNLAKAPPNYFDLIILDVFSSDSLPTHVVTLEAINVYLSKLSTDGILLIHIVNRYVDLLPILTAITHHLGLYALYIDQTQNNGQTKWVLITRNKQVAKDIGEHLGWQPLPKLKKAILWTDDFSNIFGALIMRAWFLPPPSAPVTKHFQ